MKKDNVARTSRVLGRTLVSTTCMAAALMSASAAVAAEEDQAATADQEQPAPTVETTAASTDDAGAASSDVILVTGSRITSTGFTAPTPVTSLGADRLAKTGATSIGEALAQMPAFRATTGPSNSVVGQNISPVNAGARIADLRGLGPARTLVLVDSRRFAPSTSTGTVDLNLIPTLLVSRAEIVTGGASAAYGSDAVSGVVNILLDKRLEGIKVAGGFGVTDRGDGEEYSLQVAGGTSFAGGRGHAIFGAEYNKAEGTGGCYTRDFCSDEVGNLTQAAGANGRPANNIAFDVRTSSLTPGGLITGVIDAGGAKSSARGTPLEAIQFDASGNPTDFTYGDHVGTLFMQGGTGKGLNYFFGDPLLSIPVTRYNVYGHVEYELTSTFNAFLEGSYGHVAGFPRGPETRDIGFPVPTAKTIYIDNPYLPDSVQQTMAANGYSAILLGKLGYNFGTMDSISERDSYRVVGGFDGDLGGSWQVDGYLQYGHTKYRQRTFNNRITDNFAKAIDAVESNGEIVCRVNADADTTNDDAACVPLNLLGEQTPSAAALAYSFGNSDQRTTYDQTSGALTISGEPVELWAGPVALAAGVEARRNELTISVDPISAANGFYVYNATNTSGRVDVVEGFAEVAVPLLKDSAIGSSLELNAAIRQAHYKSESGTDQNTFNTTTWKLGLTYQPVDWLLMRATRSRDIRAPNTSELFTTPVAGLSAVSDTVTGKQAFARTFTGGNISLAPERANTFTAGITLQPDGVLDGLRLSVDYYSIDIKEAIATLTPQSILDSCNKTGEAQFCDLVGRDVDNNVVTIDVPYLNLNRQKLRGFDIEGVYAINFDNGNRLDLRALATHTTDFTNSSQPGVNRAGDNGLTGLPSWVIDAFLTYTMGKFEVTAQGHFLSAGRYDASLIGPDEDGYAITLPNSINNNSVPSRFYTNLGASYTLLDDGASKVEFLVNVDNLFDVAPPRFWNGNNNTVNYDAVGRRYRMSVRATF